VLLFIIILIPLLLQSFETRLMLNKSCSKLLKHTPQIADFQKAALL